MAWTPEGATLVDEPEEAQVEGPTWTPSGAMPVAEPEDEWDYILKGGSFANLMPVPMRPVYEQWLSGLDKPEEFEQEMPAALLLSGILDIDPATSWDVRKQLTRALFGKEISPSQMMQALRENEENLDGIARAWNSYQYHMREEEPPDWWQDVINNRAAQGWGMVISGGADLMAQLEENPPPGGWYIQPTPEQRRARAQRYREASKLYWDVTKNPDLAMRRDDIVSKFFGMFAETLPYITATTVGTMAGGVPAFLTGYAVEGNIGAAVGIAAALVETVGGKVTDVFFAKVTEKIRNKAIQAGAQFAFGSISEAIEEASQEIAALTGESVYKDVDWDAGLRRTILAAGGGAALGGTFHLGRSSILMAAMGEATVKQQRAGLRYRAALEKFGKDVVEGRGDVLAAEREAAESLDKEVQQARQKAEAEAAQEAEKAAAAKPPAKPEAEAPPAALAQLGEETTGREVTVDGKRYRFLGTYSEQQGQRVGQVVFGRCIVNSNGYVSISRKRP
jgi:hypothetical protein